MLTLAIVFSLAFALNSVSFAQSDNEGAAEVPTMLVPSVDENADLGVVDACGPVVAPAPCGPYNAPCRPFFRRHCPQPCADPCYGAPCSQPCFDPCVAAPRHCFPRRAWAAPCPAPCPMPCADPCMGSCADPCGSPYGYGCRPTPIRNFFSRLFAPRYCGYGGYGCDPCYGPAPAPYGYGPYGY